MPKPKEQKRREADERNAAWAALDDITKLDRLHKRPGFSKRQRDRVLARLTPTKRKAVES